MDICLSDKLFIVKIKNNYFYLFYQELFSN